MGYRVVDEMSNAPAVISEDSSVAVAVALMKRLNIRHLPVLRKGKMIGIVSERDLGKRIFLRQKVSDLMITNPYRVKKGEKLSSVVAKMATKKYGCAVVEDKEGKVVGIFTTTDALHLLSNLLSGFDFDWQKSPQYMI